MDLYVYKKSNYQNLNDQEKVLVWFLSCMFKETGEEQLLTMDIHDFKYIVFNQGGVSFQIEDLNDSTLGTMFTFANFGERIGIRIREEILAKRYEGRKLGTIKVTLKNELAIRTAVYLHAALNFMGNWFTDESYVLFDGVQDYTGRFTPHSRETRTLHERFSYENMIGNPRNRGKKKSNA